MGCCIDVVGAVCIGGVVFRYPRFGSVPPVYRISAGDVCSPVEALCCLGWDFGGNWWDMVLDCFIGRS